MVSFFSSSRPHFHAWIDAIDRTQAVVEFGLDGTVRWANGYFLTTFGYRLEEVRGRSHRLFVDEETAESEAYDIFWSELRRGGTHQSRIRHVGVDGTEIWLHATYAPTFDRYGRVKGIILIGADVTPEVWAQAQLAEGARKALEGEASAATPADRDRFGPMIATRRQADAAVPSIPAQGGGWVAVSLDGATG